MRIHDRYVFAKIAHSGVGPGYIRGVALRREMSSFVGRAVDFSHVCTSGGAGGKQTWGSELTAMTTVLRYTERLVAVVYSQMSF